MSPKAIEDIFKNHEAIITHDGNPTTPHAELTTGLHSNGFINCRRVLGNPGLCELFAKQLSIKLRERIDCVFQVVDLVVGSSYSAITFSYEAAKHFRARHGFTEKDPRDSFGKKMIWKEEPVLPFQTVLQIEELITTSQTLFEVRRAIQAKSEHGISFLPVVGCLVHRPPKLPAIYDGIEVVALLEKEIQVFKPEDCPLCKAGSRPLRPRGNWKELVGG